VEYLYVDESGEFERDAVLPRTSLVGGFVTTGSPPSVLATLRSLHAALRAAPALAKHVGERPDLHGRDLLPALDAAGHLDAFWQLVADHLRRLPDVHLVSAHYLRDAEVLVGVASDRRAFNRYLRMWQTLVRNVAHAAPWPSSDGSGELAVCTAQRSLPLAELRQEDVPLASVHEAMRFRDQVEGVRVADTAQLPHLLRGIADRRSRAVHARRLRSADVETPNATWAQLEREPLKAGLILADLACGLLRRTVVAGVQDLRFPPVFRVAYDPDWSRYEWLAEAAPTSRDALDELLTLATRTAEPVSEIDAWLGAASRALALSLARAAGAQPTLRGLLVATCQAELDAKTGAFPRCELVFGPGALPPAPATPDAFDEHVARLTFANHAGRDVDRAAVRRLVETLLDQDVGLLLGRGEALAHLSVGLRDEFDYDEAVRLLEPWHARAQRVLGALGTGARWTTYGRVASCLAQNYAYRQEPGDLERACAIYRDVRRHLTSDSDLGQWACHAGNLGIIAGDDALLDDGLTYLFGTSDVGTVMSALEGARFTRDGPSGRLFAFTVVSRASAIGETPTCRALRGALEDRKRWQRLVENILDAPRRHPLELYARHLLEVAPPDADTEDLLSMGLEAAPGNERVPSLCRAATLAVSARRLFAAGRRADGEACARRALSTFLVPFERNEWCSPMTYMPSDGDDSIGWFTTTIRELGSSPTAPQIDRLLARFRYEWR
jgi:hypothetical protein